jgi:ketosteroid isomerase-like protein
MVNTTPGFEAQERAVREFYAALNRNDIPGFLSLLDPEIEFIEPSDYPEGGTTRGIADVEALLIRARGTWAEGGCEPERIVAAGDRIIAYVHVHVRLKDHTEWIDGRLADVFAFRDGKISHKRTFDQPEQALDWVGVEASEAI